MAGPAATGDPVADYLAAAPEPAATTLRALQAMLVRLLPESEQVIAYGVPAFKLTTPGRLKGKTVAGFGFSKAHCSYFPMSGTVTTTLADRLADYKTSKGAIQFPVDRPLPEDLVAALVAARLAELQRT